MQAPRITVKYHDHVHVDMHRRHALSANMGKVPPNIGDNVYIGNIIADKYLPPCRYSINIKEMLSKDAGDSTLRTIEYCRKLLYFSALFPLF